MAPREAGTQSVKSAWQQALRAEVLRVRKPEMARVAAVGLWLSTYANADGTEARPSRETLAALAGMAPETVTRSLKVLVSAGILASKRRPNNPTVYTLLMWPQPPDWNLHLPIYTQTRQKRAHEARKAAEIEARTASMDAVRTASMTGVPEGVHAGCSGQRPCTPSEIPDSVHGRPRTASMDAVRKVYMTGGNHDHLPPVGTPTPKDQDTAGVRPQPQVRARDADKTLQLVPPLPDQSQPEPDPGTALREALRSKPNRRTDWKQVRRNP